MYGVWFTRGTICSCYYYCSIFSLAVF